MNTSQTDRQEGTDPLNKEAYAVFIFTVANVITCPFTTLLNVLIIISVKTKVFLRTKSNIALACLAVTDAVMGLIGQPVFISLVFTRLQGEDTLNLKQAVVNAFILTLLTTLSLFHLALINVERYIAIKHSLRYATIVTEVRLIYSSAFFWIIAFLLTLPTIILQDDSIKRKISSVTMALCLALITFCQVVLYREAHRHQRQTADQQISMEVKQRKLKEKKALKTTTIVLFFLLLNYSPLIFVQILFNICVIESDNSRDILTLTAIFSVIANSFVNPIIYCARVRQFRVAFIELICRKSHAQAEGIETRVFKVLNRQ